MGFTIRADAAPALGDIRRLSGGTVYVHADARSRPDWTRYADALMSAFMRGTSIVWLSESRSQ